MIEGLDDSQFLSGEGTISQRVEIATRFAIWAEAEGLHRGGMAKSRQESMKLFQALKWRDGYISRTYYQPGGNDYSFSTSRSLNIYTSGGIEVSHYGPPDVQSREKEGTWLRFDPDSGVLTANLTNRRLILMFEGKNRSLNSLQLDSFKFGVNLDRVRRGEWAQQSRMEADGNVIQAILSFDSKTKMYSLGRYQNTKQTDQLLIPPSIDPEFIRESLVPAEVFKDPFTTDTYHDHYWAAVNLIKEAGVKWHRFDDEDLSYGRIPPELLKRVFEEREES
jgi:hypothetical protein